MNRRNINLALIAVFALVTVAHAQKPADDNVVALKNLAYKSGDTLSDYEQERCKLDLYLPKGKQEFPTLVWFHGGGLKGGNKDQAGTEAVARSLAASGVAVAAAN